MTNIGKVLKEEITRISHRTARESSTKLRKELAALKTVLIKTRREMTELRKRMAGQASAKPAPSAAAGASDTTDRRGSITAKGIVTLRKKLGLTQTAFAKLAGVTAQSVNLWEHKTGKLKLREKTAQALEGIKTLGKRDVQKQDAAESSKPAAAPQPKPVARKKASRKRPARKAGSAKPAPRKASAKGPRKKKVAAAAE